MLFFHSFLSSFYNYRQLFPLLIWDIKGDLFECCCCLETVFLAFVSKVSILAIMFVHVNNDFEGISILPFQGVHLGSLLFLVLSSRNNCLKVSQVLALREIIFKLLEVYFHLTRADLIYLLLSLLRSLSLTL